MTPAAERAPCERITSNPRFAEIRRQQRATRYDVNWLVRIIEDQERLIETLRSACRAVSP